MQKYVPTPPPPLLRFSNASIARRSLLIKNLVTHKLIEKSELAFIHIHGTKTFFIFIFCTYPKTIKTKQSDYEKLPKLVHTKLVCNEKILDKKMEK